MRPAARAGFMVLTPKLEGAVGFLYLDVRGLATTAWGVLVEPVAASLRLPWRRPDGTPANEKDIREDYARVKARTDLAQRGGMAYRNVAQLRLTQEALELVTFRKLDQIWTHLRGRFAELDTWPADAQLALVSHAWAVGPAFQWPMLLAALKSQNFTMAAVECTLREEGNHGVKPRNVANRIMWRNAAIVKKHGMNPDVLHWPKALDDEEVTEPDVTAEGAPNSEPTQPSARHTLPFGAVVGDDIAESTKRVITDRNDGD
jgi:DNA-binding Xre family transcriptional regulator